MTELKKTKKGRPLKAKKQKRIEEWNSHDLLNYWNQKYLEKNGSNYSYRSFIGKELSKFKDLLGDYDVYSILCAIDVGLDQGVDSIGGLSYRIDELIPHTSHVKILYFVKNYGRQEEREKFFLLDFLDKKWLPTIADFENVDTLKTELEQWTDSVTR